MSQLLSMPLLTYPDSNGNPRPGALANFYVTGTTTRQNTYSDSLLANPHTNPVEADSSGYFPAIYLSAGPYRLVLTDSNGSNSVSIDPVQSISASEIGEALYPVTSAELAAGVTPANFAYPPGDAQRFAVLDGSADDTLALNSWAAVPGYHSFPGKTAIISGEVALVSNSTFEFSRGAVIQTAAQNISFLGASSKTNIAITGGRFVQTSAGSAAYVAGIRLTSCSFCEVSGAEFQGMQWSGVFLDSSNYCKVIGNYFHDSLSTTGIDSGCIHVYRNSSYNEIRGNRCFSTTDTDFGILVQDPGGVGTYLPSYNKVLGNWVKGTRAYGIIVYIGGTQQGNNDVIGNTLENIDGSGVAGASGPGIYCVGHGLGSMRISNNLIRNCCISTTSAANGPGGITITDTAASSSQISVTGNSVEEMAQGNGILISTVLGGATVSNNCVRMPLANDGTGPGTGALAGNGIKVVSSDNVAVTANEVTHAGPQDAIFCFASDADHQNIKVIGNGCVSAAGNPIRFDRNSTFVQTNVTVSGNTCLTVSNTPNCLLLAGLVRGTITGNTGSCGTSPAIAITTCLGTRLSNNSMLTTGSVAFTTAGTCTGSFYDRSNNIIGTVTNSGTGFTYETAITGSATYDPASLNDGVGATTTVTVTGAALGDYVEGVSFSNDLQGITLTGYVSTTNTVAVRFQNESGGVLDLASGTISCKVIKK